MSIALTDTAAERVKNFLASDESKHALRLGITETGCSGYAYVLDLVDTAGPNDTTFDSQGITICVDPDSLKLIDGTVVDFKSEGLNQTFTFKNPREKGTCGCGESFTV